MHDRPQTSSKPAPQANKPARDTGKGERLAEALRRNLLRRKQAGGNQQGGR